MKDASPWIALYAALVATGSAVWQAATFALTGGRVKVQLRIGATNGRALVTAEPSTIKPDWLSDLAQQGYRQPIAAVRVANVGRQPVTVERWGFRHPAAGTLFPLADFIGKPLPHRLDVGQSETWAMDLGPVVDLLKAGNKVAAKRPAPRTLFSQAVASPESPGIVAVVELADGRVKRGREVFR